MGSVEYISEELIINMLSVVDELDAYEKKHSTEDEGSKINRLVVKARQGQRLESGNKPYEVDVTVHIHTNLTKAESDTVAEFIQRAVYEHDNSFVRPAGLLFAEVRPETEAERDDAKKVRKREVKFPLLIKIA